MFYSYDILNILNYFKLSDCNIFWIYKSIIISNLLIKIIISNNTNKTKISIYITINQLTIQT